MPLNPLLKTKVQSISDYSGEPLVTEEITELGNIINDKDAEIEERILAAKVMLNVCENRLVRAQRQVKHFNAIYMSLVHENEREKARVSLATHGTEKLANIEGIEDLLEKLLDRVRNK